MKKYGQILANERKERKLSQETVAKAIGITQAQISYYERDINEPSISICERLADYYGITIDELVGRDYANAQTIKNVTYKNSIHNGNNNF